MSSVSFIGGRFVALADIPTWPDHPCSPTCRRFEGAKPQAYLCMITEAGYSSPVGLYPAARLHGRQQDARCASTAVSRPGHWMRRIRRGGKIPSVECNYLRCPLR